MEVVRIDVDRDAAERVYTFRFDRRDALLVLQNQDGVTSVKAERLHALGGVAVEIDSHDFH